MLVIKNFAPWKKLWLFCLSVLKSFRLWPIQEKPIFHKLNKFSWSCLCDSHNYFFPLVSPMVIQNQNVIFQMRQQTWRQSIFYWSFRHSQSLIVWKKNNEYQTVLFLDFHLHLAQKTLKSAIKTIRVLHVDLQGCLPENFLLA